MDINKYFKENRKINDTHYPLIKCADNFEMSVQASKFHYCEPRLDSSYYVSVEVGFPSEKEDLLMEWADTPEDPTGTVYGWVPVEVVEEVIEKHGGIKGR